MPDFWRRLQAQTDSVTAFLPPGGNLVDVTDRAGRLLGIITCANLDVALSTIASQVTVAAILARLDVALSTRASEVTVAAILARLDVALSTRATEATLATRATEATLATRASQATVASILAQLDVALSTIASQVTVAAILARLDVALSTRATEATLATRATEATLATRASQATVASILAQLDVALSTRATEATLANLLTLYSNTLDLGPNVLKVIPKAYAKTTIIKNQNKINGNAILHTVTALKTFYLTGGYLSSANLAVNVVGSAFLEVDTAGDGVFRVLLEIATVSSQTIDTYTMPLTLCIPMPFPASTVFRVRSSNPSIYASASIYGWEDL